MYLFGKEGRIQSCYSCFVTLSAVSAWDLGKLDRITLHICNNNNMVLHRYNVNGNAQMIVKGGHVMP